MSGGGTVPSFPGLCHLELEVCDCLPGAVIEPAPISVLSACFEREETTAACTPGTPLTQILPPSSPPLRCVTPAPWRSPVIGRVVTVAGVGVDGGEGMVVGEHKLEQGSAVHSGVDLVEAQAMVEGVVAELAEGHRPQHLGVRVELVITMGDAFAGHNGTSLW